MHVAVRRTSALGLSEMQRRLGLWDTAVRGAHLFAITLATCPYESCQLTNLYMILRIGDSRYIHEYIYIMC